MVQTITIHLAEPQNRKPLLDVIRGVSILGILLMNIQCYAMVGAVYTNPLAAGMLSGREFSVWAMIHILADQKFLTLLSLLFGAGVILLGDRLEAAGRSANAVLLRRMVWLMIFGLVHAYLIWYGDILFAYGLCGLLVVRLRSWSPGKLLATAATVLVLSIGVTIVLGLTYAAWPESVRQSGLAAWQPPAESLAAEIAAYRSGYLSELAFRWQQASLLERSYVPVMLGVRALIGMLLGMALVKRGFFESRYPAHRYTRIVFAGFALGLPLVCLGVVENARHAWAYPYAQFIGSQFNNLGSLCMAFAYLGVVALVVGQYVRSHAVQALVAVGRTALSNYVLQSVLCTFTFYGFGLGLFEKLGRIEQLGVVLLVWIVELVLSMVWLAHFEYGPLEWVWRRLTYGRAWRKQLNGSHRGEPIPH